MCHVLIIDDEASVCRMLAYALTQYGITADTATDGADGLEQFYENNYDVVITDMRMPGMDGLAVASAIRKSAKPNTPIIAISATHFQVDQTQFNMVLEKPIEIQGLATAVKTLQKDTQ